MATALITSLAILKVNFDSGGPDYIGNFVPMVAEVLRTSSQPVMSVDEVQAKLREEFGLELPQGPVRTILRRAAASGYAWPRANARFERNPVRLEELDFARVREQALQSQRSLIARFVIFARANGRDIGGEAAAHLIAEYAKARGPSLLAAIVRPEADLDVAEVPSADQAVVHDFVAHIVRQDPDGVAELETFVKGAILYGAVFLPDLGGVSRRLGGITIVVDTRILLRALGLAGPIQEKPARELLELCYELGARLACFESTHAEIVRVLTAVENSLRYRHRLREHTTEVLEFLAAQGARPSDIALTIQRLPAMLRSIRVSIQERPAPVSALTVDEPALGRALRAATHRGYSDDALGHDVDALTAIYRLRRGESKTVLEAAGAAFVTTNRLLKQVGNSFFSVGRGPHVPLVFEDDELATIAWLKRPASAPLLPLHMAIANSFAASSPAPDLWRQYLDEIGRLEAEGRITEDDYYALRFTTAALEALPHGHGTRREDVNETTVLEVLERVRRQIRTEIRPEIQRQMAAAAEAVSRGRVAKADSDVQSAEEGLFRLSTAVRQDRQRREARFREFSTTIAERTMLLPRLVIGALLLAFAYVSVEPLVSQVIPIPRIGASGEARLLVAILAVVVALLGWRSLVAGTTLNSLFRRAEVGLATHIEAWLIARLA